MLDVNFLSTKLAMIIYFASKIGISITSYITIKSRKYRGTKPALRIDCLGGSRTYLHIFLGLEARQTLVEILLQLPWQIAADNKYKWDKIS